MAWLLAQGENIVPIPGTKRMKYLEKNVQAANIELSEEDMTEIKQLVQKYPNIGDRYNKYDFEFVNK